MTRRVHVLLLSALCLFIPALLSPATAQQAVSAPRTTVTIGVGEGRLFRLDRDASNVFIADSAIADVQVASARLLYVYGRRIGQTTLTAVGTGDNVAGSLRVRVERNADAVSGALSGKSASTLGFAGDRLVMRGPVGDVGEAMEVESTARAYSPAGRPPASC